MQADINVPTLRAALDDATAPSPVKMQPCIPKPRPPEALQSRPPPTGVPGSTRAAEPAQEKAAPGVLTRRATPEKRASIPAPSSPQPSTPSPKRAQHTPPTTAKAAAPRPVSPCLPSAGFALAECPEVKLGPLQIQFSFAQACSSHDFSSRNKIETKETQEAAARSADGSKGWAWAWCQASHF